ncbi:MAG: hypothetical protein EOM23_03695, partial [Candidatus Moranbacteria bacterium]|nr:hypothetical protein [Candidatus Moranbacteria bacterium]
PKILNKKTPLNESDWEIIKKHTVNSLQLLKGDHFELARTMALYHHERYDGSGYPLGISGEDIPIAAQITGLVDTYITLRILRKKTHSQAIEEIIFEGGQQKFNPKLMRILLDNGDAIEEKFDEA